MSLTLDLSADVRAAVGSMVPELRAAIVEAVQKAMTDRLVSVEEAATLVGVTPGSLRKRIARGTLRAVRIGRTVRLRTADLLGEVKR